jgi:predicted PurR-regulated permease PerM
MSKTLGVNPLLVFVCMLLGGVMMGVFGIILAVPIAVIFSIVFKLPEEKKILEENSEVAPKHKKNPPSKPFRKKSLK